MKTAKTIYITNPSMSLVAFLEKEKVKKNDRIKQMREKYKKGL